MAHEKLYRDPVHGLIVLDPRDAEDCTLMGLIDAPEVQRLRRIRQLGLACLAFQGAEHSRFSHAIGVMHIATRILDRIGKETRIPPLSRFATRCAALLHDVGHGPLSHVFEGVLGIDHESWTERIILSPETEVHKRLKHFHARLPRMTADLVAGRSRPAFLSRVIASQLDADRFDYLLRDSLMTGVKYGVYDLERLIHMFRIDRSEKNIVISAGGTLPVEKYLQARYHMYAQVYFHKTVRAAELMLKILLARAMRLAREGKLETGGALGGLLRDSAKVSLADYLATDDHTVFAAIHDWSGGRDEILADLSRRLLERRLFKTLDITGVSGLSGRLKRARKAVKDAGADPDCYLAVDTSSSSPYRPYNPQTPDVKDHVLVETRPESGNFVDIHEASPVVQGLAKATTSTSLLMFPERIGAVEMRGVMQRIFGVSAAS